MKRSRARLGSALLVFAVTVVPGPASRLAAENPSMDVRRTVEQFVAAWRAGDEERLRELAAPQGVVVWIGSTQGTEEVRSQTFAEALADRGSQPLYELLEIPNLQVVEGRMATVDVRIAITNGVFVDHYVLYKVGGRWKIAQKAFVRIPEPQP